MSVDAEQFLSTHPNITTIEALLPDCNGVMRGKWLPRHKLEKVFLGDIKLPLTALSLDIWGRDVEALVFESGDADGVCRAVYNSLLPTPWVEDGSFGQIMLSMHNADGTPYAGDPRQVLGQVVARFHEKNWRPVVAAELEFSLLAGDCSNPQHSCPAPAGAEPLGGDTYGVDALQRHARLLDDIRVACEIQQLPFDGLVKESAPSQYELNMPHIDDPLLAADQIHMTKRLIKGVAARHGLIASFMAKPFEQVAGNGMHVHCSVLDGRGGNVFDDGTERGADSLRHAVAGCLEFMPDAMAIYAPNENSYRRFQPGAHAPISPNWGYDNRTVALRIPASGPKARRVEMRVAGADVNPYLIYAVLLSCIFEGMALKAEPGPPIEGDGYSQAGEMLPLSLPAAVERFQASQFIRRYLGAELQRNFSLCKLQEHAEFRRRITALEYHSYLEKI